MNFDGTGLVDLTPANGNHSISWSPDFQYYVDAYSRVDAPPVVELRRAANRALVATLERGDVSALVAAGWSPPEVFVSKGRDGRTDIHGVIYRPSNFDPARRYPVIENIYAGPQGSFVPKSFAVSNGMRTLAELGFIVVHVDGMGTSNRSKAFHDVAAKNSNFISFANSNAASWPMVDPAVKDNPGIFPTPDLMPKLVPDLPESAEFTRSLTRTWTRFRTGK